MSRNLAIDPRRADAFFLYASTNPGAIASVCIIYSCSKYPPGSSGSRAGVGCGVVRKVESGRLPSSLLAYLHVEADRA